MHPHQHCRKHLTQQKTSGTSTSAWSGLHDTIPTGKDTSQPADAARRHGGILRPIQPLSHCSKYMTRQKTRNSSTSTWPSLHDTIPSGKDTTRPALPESSREVQQPRLTNKDRKNIPAEHKSQRPDNTQATATAQYTHSTLLKSSNRPMAAARRRQGQQLYAWHGTPSRRPQVTPPFPLTPAGEVIQSQPPTLPPEA